MNEVLKKSAALGGDRHILDTDNAALRYRVLRRAPHAELEAFIEHYWIIRWDLIDPFTTQVLPPASANLVFQAGGARLSGVTTGSFDYTLEGRGTVVGVMFRPGGLYPFTRRSLHELTDREIPATTAFAAADDEFNERVRAGGDDEIVQMVDRMLLDDRPEPDERVRLVNEIIARLSEDPRATVASTAQRFAMSERSLQQLFHSYVGVGVKWVIMRLRLIEAAELARTDPKLSWSGVAADLGYSDQAHFANDFRRIIGRTPTEYLRHIRV